VIGPREIREWLRAEPFRPFVIFVSDGGEFLVRHPEFVHATLTGLVVSSPDADPFENGTCPYSKLSYLHITRLEHVAFRRSTPGSGGSTS
jgi:hypothetical protein